MKFWAFLIILFFAVPEINASSIWNDMEFVQKAYSTSETLKCDASIEYFENYKSVKKDYSLSAYMLVFHDEYYSRMGTIEVVINAKEGLMIDNEGRYAQLTTKQKLLNKGDSNPITMKDLLALMDSSKKSVDTAYVLSEKNDIRTYYLSFKNKEYYKYMYFSFNTKSGLIYSVEYFFKNTELGDLSRLTVKYNTTFLLDAKDNELLSFSNYLKGSKPPKLTDKYKNFEFFIDN